jgi:hypothetical protein
LLPLWRVPIGSALWVDPLPSDEVLPSTVRAAVIQVSACNGVAQNRSRKIEGADRSPPLGERKQLAFLARSGPDVAALTRGIRERRGVLPRRFQSFNESAAGYVCLPQTHG